MVSLMMMTENQRETQILKMAFEQAQIKPLITSPSYANYIKALQYVPDVILMEMPAMSNEQLHFVRLIKRHRKTKHIPVLAYGNAVDGALRRGMLGSGVEDYLVRPLKFSHLMKIIEGRLKQQNKVLDISPRRTADEKEQDVALILDPKTLPTKKIELIVKHIASLMAFPFTVAKVLQLAEGEKAGATDLAKVIEADPVIATNILKVSNSVFFASMNRRINSIKDAIVRVGFRETKRIVMGMSVMELFETESHNVGFDRIDFWYHSLGTALFSERVAQRMNQVNSEEAFLAGLLHDFGMLLFDEFFPSIFERILEATTNEGCSFNEAAIKLLGISHSDVVGELFELWKIPVTLSEAVTSQYSVCNEEKPLETAGKKTALCVAVGSLLAKVQRLGALCDQYVLTLSDWVFRAANLLSGPGKTMEEGVLDELRMYRQFLRLDDRGPSSTGKGEVADVLQIGVVNFAGQIFVPPEYYLRCSGHTVTRVAVDESYSSQDLCFDVVLAWVGRETTAADVAPLCNVVRRTSDGDVAEGPLASVAVLVMAPDGSALMDAQTLSSVSFMRQDFDLRLLDRTLTVLQEGGRVHLDGGVEMAEPRGETAEAEA